MMRTGIHKHYCFMGLFLSLLTVSSGAVTMGEILKDDIAPAADAVVLMAEANLFDTISKGIALSLAQCEGIDICTPAVNRDELERIISTLDTRISSLSERREETGETELEAILIAYADARERYSQYIDKLATFSVAEDLSEPEDVFADDELLGEDHEESASDEAFDVFQDVDEEL